MRALIYYPLTPLLNYITPACCSYHDGKPRCEKPVGADLAKRVEQKGYARLSAELAVLITKKKVRHEDQDKMKKVKF